MSWTNMGYPASFAHEGSLPIIRSEKRERERNLYVHTAEDKMDVDVELGYFSLEVSCFIPIEPYVVIANENFRKARTAFAVEQGGMASP